MPPLELMAAFAAAAAIYAFMPGPAMLYAAAQTLGHGRLAGLMAALGIHLGGYVHVLAAALGLSALFAAVPVLYVVVKLLGAAYLVFLGLRLMCRRGDPRLDEVAPAKSARRAIAESVMVEVLNPKTALFFLAFLPQFTDAAAALPLWAQLLILGMVVNAMFTAADLVCVCMAGAILRRMKSSSGLRLWAPRLGGGLLIGLGARLALQRS